MSGYAKVFDSMFTGSMRGQADPQLVMVFLIAHAHNGVVDCHFRAISDATGLSVARVTKAIHYLEGPDPESRSPAENGRRIVRLDAHRNWGWRIVNHEVYRRRMSSLDDSYHEKKRERQQRYRDRRHARHVASRDVTPASASASVRTDGVQSTDGVVTSGNMVTDGNSAHRPSLDEAVAYGQIIGLAPWRSRDWWQEMESCGWLDYQRRPVSNWRAMVSRVKTKWEADGRPNGPPKSKAYPQLPLENCI